MLDFTAFGYGADVGVTSKLSQTADGVLFTDQDTTILFRDTELDVITDQMILA